MTVKKNTVPRLQQILWKKIGNDLVKRFKNAHKFYDRELKKFCLMLWRASIHTSSWIGSKDAMKHHCHARNNFTVVLQWNISQMLTTNTHKKFGKISKYKT